MILRDTQIEKVFDFILKTDNVKLSDFGLFGRKLLWSLRNTFKKENRTFELSDDRYNALINAFLSGESVFDGDTPDFILDNFDCISASIERNIKSIDYIRKELDKSLSDKALDLAIKNGYVLTENSPAFLCQNYIVALNSIKKDCNSANYVDWASFSKDDYDSLIEATVNAGYILSNNSDLFLYKDHDIILASIRRDISSVIHAELMAVFHPRIFKYLAFRKYPFLSKDLLNAPLSAFLDKFNMKYAFERVNYFNLDDDSFISGLSADILDKYKKRYIDLFVNALNTPPTIQNFKNIFQVCAEQEWDDFKRNRLDDYANIFSKICIELKSNDNFDDVTKNLHFLDLMKENLGAKYDLLIDAMKQYHSLVHSFGMSFKIDSLRDQISKLSALYLSKSKENYKKNVMSKLLGTIDNFFGPRKDNSFIRKRIFERKYIDRFRFLYSEKNVEICDFLEDIVKQYEDVVDSKSIRLMLKSFLEDEYSKMNLFIPEPTKWDDYIRYKSACKLINRLNCGNIKYTDSEVANYLDIIKYDSKTKKYYYCGPAFNNKEIDQCEEYSKKLDVFKKVKQKIMLRAKKLEIDTTIYDSELESLCEDCEIPFTDEFFEFQNLRDFTLSDFIKSFKDDGFIALDSIIDDDLYDTLSNYILNNGLVWVLLMRNYLSSDFLRSRINQIEILSSFDYMKDVSRLSKVFGYDISKYDVVSMLSQLVEVSSDESIAILGEDIILELCNNKAYVDYLSKYEVIRAASDLICNMAKRNKSTVPYVSGQVGNYVYSIYTPQENDILLTGIRTDACFKIGGNANDFLHYCALDKNGFVIKITDLSGNFIARASGFRNGNCVWINQLRSIYDLGGDGYKGSYANEREYIIDVFYKACDDIVKTSQLNAAECDKIDFVFTTASYALDEKYGNVNSLIRDELSCEPMDNKSDDWIWFKDNAQNLQEDYYDDSFYTDFESYDIICVAHSEKYSDSRSIDIDDVIEKDVEAVYSYPRSKVIVTCDVAENIVKKINKINAINSHFNDGTFESVKIPKGSIIIMGDDWYIIHYNGKVFKSCLLEFDERAVIEYKSAMEVIHSLEDCYQKFYLDENSYYSGKPEFSESTYLVESSKCKKIEI